MARFGVYELADGSELMLDCQADTVDVGRRLLVPLIAEDELPSRVRGLHPVFTIGGERLVMATHRMATVPDREIGRHVRSLRHEADRIMQAVDHLLTGY